MRILFAVWLFPVFFVGVRSIPVDDSFAECVEYEICKEIDGKDRLLSCVKDLAQSDKDTILEISSKYYPDDTSTLESLLDAACSGLQTAKKAVAYYYEEKFRQEKAESRPLEEEKRLQETRACVLLMVSECEIKQQMGILGF